jgi:hypothetical protein
MEDTYRQQQQALQNVLANGHALGSSGYGGIYKQSSYASGALSKPAQAGAYIGLVGLFGPCFKTSLVTLCNTRCLVWLLCMHKHQIALQPLPDQHRGCQSMASCSTSALLKTHRAHVANVWQLAGIVT